MEEAIKILNIIAWPLVIFLIFLFLRKPILNILKGITKLSYKDVEVHTSNQQSTREDSKKIPLEKRIDYYEKWVPRFLRIFSNETIAYSENIIKKSIEYENISMPEEKEKKLLEYSQMAFLIVQFMYIYNSIYGSQIKILQRLNSTQSIDIEGVKNYYLEVANFFPAFFETYPYENYINYLVLYNLITKDAENKLRITTFGRDFLKYLIDSGLSLDRAY